MSLPIEDYALIGDLQTVALAGKNGSIDWACFPRFDSDACFAALLGDERHGRWLLAPSEPITHVQRRYLPGTLILETEQTTSSGTVRLIDFMPIRGEAPDIVRIVVGVKGRVPMRLHLTVRFGDGDTVPWTQPSDDGLRLIAGPNALHFYSGLAKRGETPATARDFVVGEGERIPFVLTWHPSYRPITGERDTERALKETRRWWERWSGRMQYDGPWRDAVMRSLITLNALTYAPTGGLVAAPTTSLPESLGGNRNWDYRYCWLRDATFTLYALMLAGYMEEAEAWRRWLLRSVGGDVSRIQIMYGLARERRLWEMEARWLPGYEGSRPVRLGNAAEVQRQIDVYGEVVDTLYQGRSLGLPLESAAWELQRRMVNHLETLWTETDRGIWEVRGPEQHFTHSKVMAWVAFDRAIRSAEEFGAEGDVQRWKSVRDRIRREIYERGFNEKKNAFVQSYGSDRLDAALLLLPIVGFLPANDPKMLGTVAAIERELMQDGFVRRYLPDPKTEALHGEEGVFLACSFWLADNYLLAGRRRDAQAMFERLLSVSNDVGLLSEEYDTHAKRLLGNFPQAFSHVALVNTARSLAHPHSHASHRSR